MNVRVDRIDLTHVQIPLHSPFKISSGVVIEKDAIVVAVYSEGLVGYGEASPMAGSFYSKDSPETTWECLKNEILPRVKLRHDLDRSRLDFILDQVQGNSFAKAGIETALWDLEAMHEAVPLWRLLGGTQPRIPSGLAVGIVPTVSELLHDIERHLAEGYKRVKIKIEPSWDLEPVKGVREHFGNIPLMVDANAAYRQVDIPLFEELDEYGLMMFEQPLGKDDLVGHAELQSKVRTPVCLDESAKDIAAVKDAIALGSCKVINIKIQRMGGLEKARQVHDLCRQAGIAVWAGTMPELGIGSVQAIHLSSLPDFSYATDVESSFRWFVDDIIDPWIEVKDGWLTVPNEVGYGFRIDEKKVQKYTVRSETFR
ncbi:MAG: o-succinylbenzoate synthase [Bacteroidota bacterium]